MKYCYLFLLLLACNIVFTQVYFCDQAGGVGIIDIEDCSYDYFRLNATYPPFDFGGTYTDIALHPDGRLFGTTSTFGGEQRLLVELSVQEGSVIDTLGVIPEEHCSSLVCSPSGVLYMGYSKLHSFDLATGNFTTHGYFPSNRRLLGDLLFLDGKLLGALGDIIVKWLMIYFKEE